MLFNSLAFFVFAAAFFALWPLAAPRPRPRLALIAAASLVFYGFWDPRYVVLLVGTGICDFTFGLAMERAPRAKTPLLAASLVVNLGTLFAFKYSGFAARVADGGLAALGKPTHLADALPAMLRVLPPGISFYTFQSMSYTIDVHQGRLKPTRSFLHFLAFISMFPQLVAGPIVRARDLLPALLTHRAPDAGVRFGAVSLVAFGFFKKVVVADNLAATVEAVYGAPQGASSFAYWMATVMFAMQIYCDFSGYSDIARGLARLMGYEFPQNFDHPYAARSMRDFWRSWHMSLSSWFRDYVYLPLGGREHPTRNLWITMLLSGLWHGASFTFLAWGAWHALLVTVERAARLPERAARSSVGRVVAAPVVFVAVCVGWVFFRASSLPHALRVLRVMTTSVPVVDLTEVAILRAGWPLFFLAVGVVAEWIARAADARAADARAAGATGAPRSLALRSVGVAVMVAACVFLRGPGNAFIYFQF
ncbi:MAG: MBOAT family protein [Myxococcales bacterium]|nr:MBOAT family protein [Myxococcales bacterium]